MKWRANRMVTAAITFVWKALLREIVKNTSS